MNSKYMSIKRNVVSSIALCAAAALPTAALSGEVTLKSPDGSINVTGELMEFTGDNYVVKMALGNLNVAASKVQCQGEGCPSLLPDIDVDVTFAGSNSIAEGIMSLLIAGYASHREGVSKETPTGAPGQFVSEVIGDDGFGDRLASFMVSSSESADAFSRLLDGSAQIGMSSRRILPDEARALRDSGAGSMIRADQEHIIASDSLVFIMHPDNPVGQMSIQQLREILTGGITNWSEVGGPDMPIQLVLTSEGTASMELMDFTLFDGGDPLHPEDTILIDNNIETANFINSNPNSMGMVGNAFVRGAKPLTLISDCGLVMVPDSFSVRTEEYALQRFLYLYNRADTANEAMADFVDFAVSDAADEVIAKSGFIDLGIERQSQSVDSPRAKQLLNSYTADFEGEVAREMMVQMVDYDRLSSTFRFRTGSSQLDERGMLNLDRLKHYLEAQPEGTEVLFVGFTDDVGAFESNRKLAMGRANSVLTDMQSFAGDTLDHVTMSATGFGEVSPAVCNNFDSDRAINRRVEVWIKSPKAEGTG